MRKNSFAIAARDLHRDNPGVVHIGSARAGVRPSEAGARVPLRLTWRRNPRTGRVEGSWQALPGKPPAVRRTRSVVSSIAGRRARSDAA
jgi:hypothetical protein